MNYCGNCYYSSLSSLFCFKLDKTTTPMEACPEHKTETSSTGRSEALLRLIDIQIEKDKRENKINMDNNNEK